ETFGQDVRRAQLAKERCARVFAVAAIGVATRRVAAAKNVGPAEVGIGRRETVGAGNGVEVQKVLQDIDRDRRIATEERLAAALVLLAVIRELDAEAVTPERLREVEIV